MVQLKKEKAGTMASKYRFSEGGVISAVLDWPEGTLTLKEENASIETFQSWKDYVKDVCQIEPTKGDEMEIVAQLSLTLGTAEMIDGTPVVVPAPRTEKAVKAKKIKTEPVAAQPAAEPDKETEEMKNATVNIQAGKAAPKVVKDKKVASKPKEKAPAAKKVVDSSNFPECSCGCGDKVKNAKRLFLQGHDARTKGYCLQVERGEMKFTELQPITQKYFRDNGYKANSQKSAA